MHPLLLTLLLTSFSSTELTWNDFKGRVPENQLTIAARTQTALGIETSDSAGYFTCKVYPIFIDSLSWVRVKTEANLSHEITHWRICQLKAALCNRALAKYQNKQHVSESVIMKIYNHYRWEIDDLNKQFDHESNHGLNATIEAAYERHIIHDLNLLK